MSIVGIHVCFDGCYHYPKPTELDTQELRELEREVAKLFGDSQVYEGGWHINYDGKYLDMTNEVCSVARLIAQREQAAELQGKTTVLKKLASKTTPRYEDTHPEYTKGFEEMKSKVKFELQRLQATKPEKGTEE